MFNNKLVSKSSPIAVLDTGAGGLSVAYAIRKAFPKENIHYFADTAHLPYGIKSPALIRHLACRMAKEIKKESFPKLLVVACHTMSVLCLKDIASQLGVKTIGLLEPTILGIKSFLEQTRVDSLGIISTKATLESGAYSKAWPKIDESGRVKLVEYALGPLVSLVEEGNINDSDFEIVLNHMLPPEIKELDALLVGCTHFSSLTSSLKRVMKPGSQILDAKDFVKDTIDNFLKFNGLESDQDGDFLAFVSDNAERFSKTAKKFMPDDFEVRLMDGYAIS